MRAVPYLVVFAFLIWKFQPNDAITAFDLALSFLLFGVARQICAEFKD
jgi:hypothetical protein